MDWFADRLDQENPTLDYHDLLDHADDFKTLLDQKIIKHAYTIDSISCDLCDEGHTVSPTSNSKGQMVIICSGSRRVVNPNELKIWTINRDILIKNVRSKNPVIDKASFERTAFSLRGSRSGNKLSTEPIMLKAISVEIRGREIFYRGTKTIVTLTETDRRIVYFLYTKYRRDSEERVTLDQLASEPFADGEGKKRGSIKNRITEINKTIRQILAIKGKASGISLIINGGHGYRLNPKLMEVGGGSN